MKLSEKLYWLRKKSGLSQEQLAEQMDVSRQAVSKWESGASLPDSESLIAISRYFGVSVDYLLKEELETPDATPPAAHSEKTEAVLRYAGLAFCLFGFLCLMVWGVLMLANPTVSEEIAATSTIKIDGRGILLAICSLFVALGIILLLKKGRRYWNETSKDHFPSIRHIRYSASLRDVRLRCLSVCKPPLLWQTLHVQRAAVGSLLYGYPLSHRHRHMRGAAFIFQKEIPIEKRVDRNLSTLFYYLTNN